MTKWLSHRMVERGIIKEEEQELYQFGIRNGMILLLNVVTALVIGLLTEQLAVVAVFTLSFMVLRSYTGGYHSDSRIFCYLGSNLVLLVPVYTQAGDIAGMAAGSIAGVRRDHFFTQSHAQQEPEAG